LTLFLSEREVERLIDMREVVTAVEEAFRYQGKGEVSNFMRTRSRGASSVLNVMHANLPYLRRGGLKAYMSSRAGTRFVILLFDSADSAPLAVMGAGIVGRYRTGAASAVATKFLYGKKSGRLAILGSGKQALTQVLALEAVMSLDGVSVWSPTRDHREAFAARLSTLGFNASSSDTARSAMAGADLASTITSASVPFITDQLVSQVSHLNACGGNDPDRSELTPDAVSAFDSVVVDDIPQAKLEYGELIQAAKAGRFIWEKALDLGSVVTGSKKPSGRTLFKSGGAALEDVAVASMLYDKAVKSGSTFPAADLV
jgi:alanine dehydrogenase